MAIRMTRDEQAEDTRRRLLAAAHEVFERDGFHGATLEAVAEAAGFTKGAVYSRFASKADLFLALLEQRIETRIGEIRAVSVPDGGAEAEVAAQTRGWLASVARDRDWSLLMIEFRAYAARHPEVNERYAELHGRLVDALAEAAVASGAPDPARAPEVVRAALALNAGAMLERLAQPEALDDALLERANVALVRHLAAEAR